MIAALLLAASAPQDAVEAERAFAADARALGQWTAFRKWSTDKAVMFVPRVTNAHQWLKDRRDPPEPIDWWPTASWVSCDGQLAVNTGGWRRPDGSVGYFSTVWRRQADGAWKWIVDSGDTLKTARERPAEPSVTRATCTGNPPRWEDDDDAPGVTDTGSSPDSTLIWRWIDWGDGEREFTASVWNGEGWAPVIEDRVEKPAP